MTFDSPDVFKSADLGHAGVHVTQSMCAKFPVCHQFPLGLNASSSLRRPMLDSPPVSRNAVTVTLVPELVHISVLVCDQLVTNAILGCSS
ncbi:hypothetical protein PI125_g15143 [Phytophthora idaei]|nr:hypothetical protein PI125_g15143 [Phytophthora idaei]KAG3144091.1 hypothetical protein PI126_g14315 [Phytophthora idaei]